MVKHETKPGWVKWLDATLIVKVLVIGLILVYLVTQFPYFYPFPEITSWSVANLLSLLGVPSLPWKNVVVAQGLPTMEISAECSGVVLLMIFPLIIFLIPNIKLSHRLASLLFIPILYFGNVLRITMDAFVGLNFGVDKLVIFHDTVGQVFVFFWTILLYIIWLRLFNNFPREQKAVHPDGYD